MGPKDAFSVKLKQTTSYTQLPVLAAENNCSIESVDMFDVTEKEFIINFHNK